MILLPQSAWEIKSTESKGKGIFACKNLQAGIVIGDYIGRVLRTATDDTTEKDGLYLMYYHDYASLYPQDITATGIHLMNHSCVPNCWITIYHGHTLFFTLRPIFAGEELTVSYQLSPQEYCSTCTHTCYCGALFCTKTMHLTLDEFRRWQTFSETQARQTKRMRIRYGKTLPLLPDYPKTIADHTIYTLFGSFAKKPLPASLPEKLSVMDIRRLIRQTGRRIYNETTKQTIHGIKNNKIITQPGLV